MPIVPELSNELRAATDAARKLVAELKQIGTAISSGQSIGKVAEETNKLTLAEKELAKIKQTLERETVRQNAAYQAQQKELIGMRVAQNEVNKTSREQARAAQGIAGAFDRLNATMVRAQKHYKNMAVLHGVNSREAQIAKSRFDRLADSVNRVNNQARDGRPNVGRYFQSFREGFSALVGPLGVAGAVLAIAGLTRAVFGVAKTFEGLNLALKRVTGTSIEYAQAKQFLTRVAKDYGVELEALTRAYMKFDVSARSAGMTTKASQEIFESVTKASASLGLTTADTEGVLRALEQMLSKNQVMAEELKLQLGDRLPGSLGIMARALGVSTAQLQKMMKNGEVIASEVLPKFAKELEKTFGTENLDKIETMQAGIAGLTTAWQSVVMSFENGTGVISKSFGFLIGKSNDFLTVLRSMNEGGVAGFFRGAAAIGGGQVSNLASAVLLQDKQKELEVEKRLAKFQQAATEIHQAATARNLATYEDWIEYMNKNGRPTLQRYIGLTQSAADKTDLYTMVQKKFIEASEDRQRQEAEAAVAEEKAAEERKKREKKAAKDRKDREDRDFKARMELLKLEAEANISVQERIKNNETLSREERSLAAAEEYTIKKKLLDDLLKLELSNHKLTKNEVLAIHQKYNNDVMALDNELDDFNEDIFQSEVDRQEKLTEKRIELLKESAAEEKKIMQELFDMRVDLARQAFDTLVDIAGSFSERRLMDIDAESERLDAQKDRDLERAGENAERKNQIEEQYVMRQEALAKRAGKIKERQAKLEKAAALVQVGVSTALGVLAIKIKLAELKAAAALNRFLLPLIPLVATQIPLTIASGALASASIAARPIPRYSKGTKNHPGGLAEVGEIGTELVKTKTGEVFFTPPTSTFMNLPTGAKVYTANQTKEIIRTERMEGHLVDIKKIMKNQRFPTKNGYRSNSSHVKFIDKWR